MLSRYLEKFLLSLKILRSNEVFIRSNEGGSLAVGAEGSDGRTGDGNMEQKDEYTEQQMAESRPGFMNLKLFKFCTFKNRVHLKIDY